MWRRNEPMSHVRRTSFVCALTAVLAAWGAWAGSAYGDEIDLSLPAGQPQYTEVAPVPYYEPAIDAENPGLVPPMFGEPDNLPQQVSVNVTTGGSTTSDYVGLILDRDASDNLFIKVQQQDSSGKFSHIGFYHGNAVGGWPGMTGGAAFFALAAGDKFTSARMSVTHDGAGNVTLRLTDVVGGNNNQLYVRGGWTPRTASGSGFGGWTGTYPIDNFGVAFTGDVKCDNFNRRNGGLGGDWVTTDGTASIVSFAARGDSNSRSIYIGSCGVVNSVEADIGISGTGNGNSALILDDDGDDRLYIKVQQQSGGGEYDTIGFYHLRGTEGAWPGQTGGAAFFSIPAAERFSSAHMKVTLTGDGDVRLILTKLDGVATRVQEYQRGGWIFQAGKQVGFGGWTGNSRVDNIASGGNVICDNFNRPNGPLGANWDTIFGTASISSNAAYGDNSSVSLFTGVCGACNDPTSPVVDITAPATFACVCNVITVSGSVSDPDGEYIDDVLEYRRSDLNVWTVAANGVGPRVGVLYNWNAAALSEGWYFFRVTGFNACGLSSNDSTMVRIARSFDTIDVRSPTDGMILGGTVCVDGTAEDNQCFDHYTVMYKPAVGGAYAPVDPAFPTYPVPVRTDPLASWNTAVGPTAVPDGNYLIRVQGFDVCNNTKEVIRSVKIDNTAPVATIAAPPGCKFYTGVVQITGTANDANFGNWALYYTGGNQHGLALIAQGNAPVINGVFANWDTAALPWCAYTLRLVVTDKAVLNCGPWVHQTDYYTSLNVGKACDINGDGQANNFDIDPFVFCLTHP